MNTWKAVQFEKILSADRTADVEGDIQSRHTVGIKVLMQYLNCTAEIKVLMQYLNCT